MRPALRKGPGGGRLLLLLLAAAAFLLPGCGGDGSPVPPVPQRTAPLVLISDLHFDPFYDPALFPDLVATPAEMWAAVFEQSAVTAPPAWGQETNYPLLALALDAMGREAAGSPLAIFGGDILSHNFNETFFTLYGERDEAALRAFVHKTVVFVARQMRRRLGGVPVAAVLGNNDSYSGDYALVPGGQFLADTAGEFYETFLLGGADPLAFLETYTDGGYYTARPPGCPVELVGMSTVLFSRQRPAPEGEGVLEAAADRQLTWLEDTLAGAAGQGRKVWLVMHIPPGADIYATVSTCMDETGHISDAVLMWHEEYQARFLEIAGRYEGVIEASFSGHTHMDEYRLDGLESEEGPDAVVNSPAITPLFGNDPAFKVFSLQPETWQLVDYLSVHCDLASAGPAFQGYYDFSLAYGASIPLQPALADLFPALAADPAARASYTGFYYCGHDAASEIDAVNWPAYWCGIAVTDRAGYMECVNSYP